MAKQNRFFKNPTNEKGNLLNKQVYIRKLNQEVKNFKLDYKKYSKLDKNNDKDEYDTLSKQLTKTFSILTIKSYILLNKEEFVQKDFFDEEIIDEGYHEDVIEYMKSNENSDKIIEEINNIKKFDTNNKQKLTELVDKFYKPKKA